MKMNVSKWALTFCGALLSATLAQAADAPVRLMAQPGCVVTIDGTSTIHDWTVKGAIIGGFFEIEPAFLSDKTLKSVASLNTKGTAPKSEASIPVRSLKSSYTKMDEIMQEAMGMKTNPTIKYWLKEMVAKAPVPDSGTPVKFDTKGDLAVAGVTNSIDMEVTMERLEGDKVKFVGSKVLKMTDFKITPPAPKIALGMIKTGDDVTVKFEWITAPKKEVPAQQ
jgi:hypothetical protein